LVAISPVVCRAHTVLPDEEVFRIVDVLVRAGLDAIDYLRETRLAPPPFSSSRASLQGQTYSRLQID
jgi:hypothetical protein